MTEPAARVSRLMHVRSFSWRDWRDLIEASMTLAWVHVALRMTSPARVIARASALRARPAPSPDKKRLARVAWLVGAAGRHIVPVPCLSRSVALVRVLTRRGAPAALRIGVRTTPGGLEAHAWVVVDGVVVNDEDETVRQYVPFDQPLTAAGAARPEFR